ncbi:MAG TPA: glycosyltransferase family 4 protein [Patescibacteria group bacterium]|nr:glycosyltransferase family 4 protein [Patescibacteria group bacterium]
MKVLLISSYLPYPLHSGGQVRLYNLIKQLAGEHEITLICEKRQHQTMQDIAEVEKICKEVICIPRKKQWSIENIVKTGISQKPFLITGHTLTQMQQIIVEVLNKKKFDLIHVETFYVAQNLPKTDLPIVLVEHNIEYLIYQRFMDKAPLALKPLLLLDIKKLKKAEEDCWKRANHVVAVSQEEKKVIDKFNSFVSVVPNGVDLGKFKVKDLTKKSKEKKILFIGDFSYIQNRDATQFIIREVAPILRKIMKDVNLKFWFVGRRIPQTTKDLANSSDIVFDDQNPSSTEEIFSAADVLLSPIRMGAGTQYKILEAMAVGTPVVTTKLGNEGVNAIDNKEILVADKAEEIAEKVKLILENDKLYKTIALNARKLIEERFDWETIAEKLERVYETVVKK